MNTSVTIKQHELFKTGTSTAATLPSQVQIEIVRLLCELILEQRRPPNPNVTSSDGEMSR